MFCHLCGKEPLRRNASRYNGREKIGGAVQRNRAKRVITAAFRECLPGIKPGYDFVIVARTRILEIKSTAAAQTMKKQLSAAGIYDYDRQNIDKAD